MSEHGSVLAGKSHPRRRLRLPGRAVLLSAAVVLLAALPVLVLQWPEVRRFFSFQDGFLRDGVAGTMLLALNCALLGTLLVARRMSMLGDTLSHAVLPGIAAGFLWTMSRNPVALVTGAVATGVLSSLVVSWIARTTRLKPDAALSVVLTVFFAVGIALIKMLPDGNKAGIDRFLYGQAAAISAGDVLMLAVTAGITLLSLLAGYRGFLVLAFDETFGRAIGLPVRMLHYVQMFLTTLAVVVSMEAVGVILVAGLLVIPASTAWLLSTRLSRILWLSALLGVFGAVMGTFISFTGERMAAGPTLVLCSGIMFAAAFLFSPQNGLARRAWQWVQHGRRIRREDSLKAIYRLLEERGFTAPLVSAGEAGCSAADLRTLVHHGCAVRTNDGRYELTAAGFREASRMVRNHRLWELYLTRRAGFAGDHVHDSAEEMEHLLAEENIAQMMQVLEYPVSDPHGKRIPALEDTIQSAAARHE